MKQYTMIQTDSGGNTYIAYFNYEETAPYHQEIIKP